MSPISPTMAGRRGEEGQDAGDLRLVDHGNFGHGLEVSLHVEAVALRLQAEEFHVGRRGEELAAEDVGDVVPTDRDGGNGMV